MEVQGEEKQEQQQQKQEESKVSLSKEEYAEMVNTINEMKGTIEAFVRDEASKDERKRVEEERKKNEEPKGEEIDLDLLSNKKLASIIFHEVENRVAKPLLQAISLLAVKDEKRDLEKFLSKEGENIEDYEDDIVKVATEKPTLSLMEAYKIVKQERNQLSKQKEKEEKEKLDKKEKEEAAGGEKPSGGKFTPGGKLSLESASERAFRELKDTFPTEREG